jgi:hypothetical protein
MTPHGVFVSTMCCAVSVYSMATVLPKTKSLSIVLWRVPSAFETIE